MSKIKDSFFGGAEKKAAKAQERGFRRSAAEQRKAQEASEAQLAPFEQAGLGALETRQGLLGLLGPEEQQAALGRFQESPGQAFLRERQEQTLLRNQAAIGGLGGGNIRTALQEQAAGIAGTQLGEFQDRLANLTAAGQSAATNLTSLRAGAAGNIGQAQIGAGQARGQGILGQAAGFRSGVAQLAQLGGGLGFSLPNLGGGGAAASPFGSGLVPSDIRLKTNIVKIGELENGLNWYSWEWNEVGARLAGDQPTEGVIAQEAQKVVPEAVTEGLDGYLRVNYKGLR